MSTYSSNLRYELITTGTQAGTWGTTTNTNLGTLVEGSVAGYTIVNVSSTAQALTANNGAADEARLAILQLTTSGISTAFAIYAPPATKQYTIYNASSYTATIYNSTVLGNTTAAGTGISIPAGATMAVWSNGTSFYQQSTYLNSPVINTPTIASGTLTTPSMSSPTMTGTPVAPTAATSTNTTQVATTAFVQGEKASPAFTGTPTAPTATYGTNTTQIATTAFVQAAFQAIYPIGSIYSSTVSTNPGTLFGFGTWVAYAAGRVMIGTDGSTYAAGATGGSADAVVVAHTHGITDPTHNHAINYQSTSGGSDYGSTTAGSSAGYATQYAATGITINSAGVSGTNANLQPYVVVYMWNRTA